MSKRGRPKLDELTAHEEAARVINVAHALRYRHDALPALGFPSAFEARRYVGKRRRGRIGELIGDSVRHMLFPVTNLTDYATALVLVHELTPYRAAKLSGVGLPNLKRAIKQRQKAQQARAQERPHPVILSVQVEDLS